MSKNNNYRQKMAESKERLQAMAHTVPVAMPEPPQSTRPQVVRPTPHAIVFEQPCLEHAGLYDEFRNRYNESYFWILRQRITNKTNALAFTMVEYVNNSGSVNCVSVAK